MEARDLSPGQLIVTGSSPLREDSVYYARRLPTYPYALKRIDAGTLGVFLGDYFFHVTTGAEGAKHRAIVLVSDEKVLIPFNLLNSI
jgi:hypothetical protein